MVSKTYALNGIQPFNFSFLPLFIQCGKLKNGSRTNVDLPGRKWIASWVLKTILTMSNTLLIDYGSNEDPFSFFLLQNKSSEYIYIYIH